MFKSKNKSIAFIIDIFYEISRNHCVKIINNYNTINTDDQNLFNAFTENNRE